MKKRNSYSHFIIRILLFAGCLGIFCQTFAQQIPLPNSCFDTTTTDWTVINGGNGAGQIKSVNRSKSKCSTNDTRYMKWDTYTNSGVRNPSLPYLGPGTYTAGAYLKRPAFNAGNTLAFRLIIVDNGISVVIANSDTISPGGGWGNGVSGYFLEDIILSHVCTGSCQVHLQLRSHNTGTWHVDSMTLKQTSPTMTPITVQNSCFAEDANSWTLLDAGNGVGVKNAIGNSKSRCSATDYNFLEWKTFAGSSMATTGLPYLGSGEYIAGTYIKMPTGFAGNTFFFRLTIFDNGSPVQTLNSPIVSTSTSWGQSNSGYEQANMNATYTCGGTCTMNFEIVSNQTGTWHLDSISLRLGLVLPTDFGRFELVPGDREMHLDWTVDSHQNMLGFSIERKREGQSGFEEIDWVSAQRNTDYQYNDKTIIPHTRYFYRLRHIDQEGTVTYSPIREAMSNEWTNTGTLLYPNPASHTLTIELRTAQLPPQFEVFDLHGKRIPIELHQEDSHLFRVNLANWKKGMYILLERYPDGLQKTQKFVIAK